VHDMDPALAAELAAVDTPAADAERAKRAEVSLAGLSYHDLGVLGLHASIADTNHIRNAFRTDYAGPQTDDWYANASAEARRRARSVALQLIKDQLRIDDIRSVWADPDRLEDERIRSAYNVQVAAVARTKGNEEPAFVSRFAELIVDRREAVAHDDADAIRAAEVRLQRHTGVPWPQVPSAAWESADTLPAAERADEYARLEAKYGPRNPSANGTGAGKKSRTRRLSTRPLVGLETR
jgi:hypothetical protein